MNRFDRLDLDPLTSKTVPAPEAPPTEEEDILFRTTEALMNADLEDFVAERLQELLGREILRFLVERFTSEVWQSRDRVEAYLNRIYATGFRFPGGQYDNLENLLNVICYDPRAEPPQNLPRLSPTEPGQVLRATGTTTMGYSAWLTRPQEIIEPRSAQRGGEDIHDTVESYLATYSHEYGLDVLSESDFAAYSNRPRLDLEDE